MGSEKAPGAECQDGTCDEPTAHAQKTVEQLKEQGNQAFKKAQLLRRTTAGRQYLSEAKGLYGEALGVLGNEAADERGLSLACALHANLAAIFLLEDTPNWLAAKAAADIALSVNPRHAKALYRRAQALLEDGRQGLPEASLRAALDDLRSACEVEPRNSKVVDEAERIQRRIVALEEARRVPKPHEIADRIMKSLLDRGGDLLVDHGYLWGQTESTVHIFLPTQGVRVTKSSEVTFEVHVRSLSVALPRQTEGLPFKLSGNLHKMVQPDESSWQLEDHGLLLHIELTKRDQTREGEHWLCVWEGHEETVAPSAEERREISEFVQGACLAKEQEEQKPRPPAAENAIQKLREMCPGVNIEWGDTSFDSL